MPVGSVRKLGGAPARVHKLVFAADGKSVLALERRPSELGELSADNKYAITRRPVAGGEATEVHVSGHELVDFAPLGDDVLVLDRQMPLPLLSEQPGESKERQQLRELSERVRAKTNKGTVLLRVAPGQEAVRISPEGERCFHVVGAAGGQWVAFSVSERSDRPELAIVHVRGAKPDERHTLSRSGIAYDISPDGARVLILRQFPPSVGGELPPLTVFDLTAVNMVDVKSDTIVSLPGSLQIDGAEIPTAKLAVRFSTDGLVFHSERGEVYRSALDGSKAVRVAGPLPEANGAASGNPASSNAASNTASGSGMVPVPSASSSAGAGAGAPGPAGGPIRILDRRGVVLELREDGAAVEVSRPYVDSAHPKAVSAALEGPLAALGPVAVDATGTRMAFAVLSDTSRDGVFDRDDDDAAVFVSEPAKGSLALERTQTPLLADELRPKIAAGLAIPPSSVTIVHTGWILEVTAELPWIEGEKAQALIDRMMVAARALDGAVPQKHAFLRLRVGPFETRVLKQEEGGSRPYVALNAPGVSFRDPAALPLVLRDPVLTSITGGSYGRTLTGTIENTGTTPMGPIEVIVSARPDSPDDAPRFRREVKVTVGVIEPGKRAPYKVNVWPSVDGIEIDASFLVGGKPITLLNDFIRSDGMDWLETALAVRAEHGAWIESDFALTAERPALRVRLSDSHVALAEAARTAVMERIQKALRKHFGRFHKDHWLHIQFMAPGGGGWLLEDGKKPVRFEPKKGLDSPR